jgi:hypothetical protein
MNGYKPPCRKAGGVCKCTFYEESDCLGPLVDYSNISLITERIDRVESAPICLSCGAKPDSDGTLPCGH